jgi:hypothetical protein
VPVTTPFKLWVEVRIAAGSARMDQAWTEHVVQVVVSAVLDLWAHHPDAAGREHGDPRVSIGQGPFNEDVVNIVATLREV